MEPVSVVIATYDRAALLPATLSSVVRALGPHDEIVVADDGSRDATEAVVCDRRAEWAGRVRYLALPHGGAGRAFNAGIAAARHSLVAFADSDDLWLPWRLALQRPVLRDLPVAFCFGDFAHEWADGRREPHWVASWSEDTRPWDEILGPGERYAARWPLPEELPAADRHFRVHVGDMSLQQLRRNYMSVNTLLVSRGRVGDRLRFGEDLPRLADWECYARLVAAGPAAYLDVDLAVQRAHAGPRLSRSGRLNMVLARAEIIERTWARDPAFMQAHGEEVGELLERLRREAARKLILEGRRAEARPIVSRLHHGWRERIALHMPAQLVAFAASTLHFLSEHLPW